MNNYQFLVSEREQGRFGSFTISSFGRSVFINSSSAPLYVLLGSITCAELLINGADVFFYIHTRYFYSSLIKTSFGVEVLGTAPEHVVFLTQDFLSWYRLHPA